MRSLLIRLYPARWRARYGDEFEAILEERPLGPFDVADILLGALDARLRLRRRGADNIHGRGLFMSLRIGGFAAILGGALWSVAGLLTLGIVADITGAVPTILLLSGLVSSLVAVAGLSAFQARTNPALTWTAFGFSVVGTIAVIGGFVGLTFVSEAYWDVWMVGLLATLVGSGLFALITYRTAALSRVGAVLLGLGSSLPFTVFVTNINVTFIVALSCLTIGWVALGIDAIRIDRPAPERRPA
jgi:hypothetical protein